MQNNPLLRTNDELAHPPESYPDSPDRVADARRRHGSLIAEKFRHAGLAYPAAEIFFRVLKYEGQMELWGRNKADVATAFQLVSTYPILRASGRLGPKRQEGDSQVPEGFYVIERFNPKSAFHLSLGINYPNASDLILTTDRKNPGSDVYIHGASVSIGCLAMGDPVIEELFLAAIDAKTAGQKAIQVHIFPCRMNAENWSQLLNSTSASNGSLHQFWRGLQPKWDDFERTRRCSAVKVASDGSYY